RAPLSSSPSTNTRPPAARCQPSSKPTKLDLPAPDEPTIATWLPASISKSISLRIRWPPASALTFSKQRATPAETGRGGDKGKRGQDYFFPYLPVTPSSCLPVA